MADADAASTSLGRMSIPLGELVGRIIDWKRGKQEECGTIEVRSSGLRDTLLLEWRGAERRGEGRCTRSTGGTSTGRAGVERAVVVDDTNIGRRSLVRRSGVRVWDEVGLASRIRVQPFRCLERRNGSSVALHPLSPSRIQHHCRAYYRNVK